MSLFHEMRQEQDISRATTQASSANQNSQNAKKKIEELETKLEMSLMVSEALWEIIKKSQYHPITR